jgi:hypothetical protein
MPTWPSGSKASTTNVDQPNDLIRLARPDIKQNIDNVNDIIDTLNIATPNNNDTLQYNSTTGVWDSVAGFTKATAVIDSFNLSFVSSNTDYSGGFSIVGTQNAGITTGTSGGKSTLTIPAGTWIHEIVETKILGSYGAGIVVNNLTANWKNINADSGGELTIFTTPTRSLSFYFRFLGGSKVFTIEEETTIYLEYNHDNTFDMEYPQFLLTKIA